MTKHEIATKQKAVEVLQGLLKLFGRNGKNWIKGIWAQDANGITCGSRNAAACRFCLEGGLIHLSGRRTTVRTEAQAALAKHTPYHSVINFNDTATRTWPEVKVLIQQATKDLKTQLAN
jgi:hypothetical protein